MVRYIDADKLYEWAKEFYPNDTQFMSAILNAPTADVVEVKHGEWIEKTNTYNYSDEDFEYLECSICGNCSPVQYSSPYCSECGAKMDGEQQKNDFKEGEQLKIQEAIENLKYLISGDCTNNQMDFVEEIEMAINALKKQIPQKPIEDGYYDEPAVCPNCGCNVVKFVDNSCNIQFCHFCGQKLELSDHLTD